LIAHGIDLELTKSITAICEPPNQIKMPLKSQATASTSTVKQMNSSLIDLIHKTFVLLGQLFEAIQKTGISNYCVFANARLTPEE
jgi:hypothetical protein